MRRLAEAGIDVGVGMAPILPLSDRLEQPEEVVREARAAGARRSGRTSSTSAPNPRALPMLAEDWPEEVERYEQLYRAYLPSETAKTLTEPVRRGSVLCPPAASPSRGRSRATCLVV